MTHNKDGSERSGAARLREAIEESVLCASDAEVSEELGLLGVDPEKAAAEMTKVGITFGDYLIDSGHYDITPEQEREIEAREECDRRGIDPDEICADSGVTAWMVVDQQIRNDRTMPEMVEQPCFTYFECPECGFDSVQRADLAGSAACPLCAGDSGHDVTMTRRTARSSDKPEGRDARKDAPTHPAQPRQKKDR